MKPGTWTFQVNHPEELGAGLRGFTDTVTITVESGDPGGELGEFANFISDCLNDWYDGGVTADSLIGEGHHER